MKTLFTRPAGLWVYLQTVNGNTFTRLCITATVQGIRTPDRRA